MKDLFKSFTQLVCVSDTSIATVASAAGYAGVLTMVGNGKLTVTVYAKYDLSVKQEYTLHVGDEGENTGETPGDSELEMPKDDTDEMPEGGEVSDNTVKKGTIFSVGTYKYKIIGLSEVAFVGLTSSKITTAKIPKSVTINRKNFKVTSVADKAFLKSKIKSVTVGSNVKTIGSSTFKGCSRLRKTTIGSSVAKIGNNAFENCSILKSVTIPINVTSIGARAFSGCKKLSVINIKSMGLKSVGRNAFERISSSAKIKVPSKKLSVYKKLLKIKGQEKNVKISK